MTSFNLPPSLPQPPKLRFCAVIGRLPALQNLRLAHNRLSGNLSCDLMAGPLAELDVAGAP